MFLLYLYLQYEFQLQSLMKRSFLMLCAAMTFAACYETPDNPLKLNDKEYFENQGVNVLVFSNTF